MFWTKFVKSVAKIILVISLISTFIFFLYSVRISVFAGLISLVLGIAGSFLLVSGIMLVCEISENIGAIKNHLTGASDASNTSNAFSFNDFAQNLGVNMGQNVSQTQAPMQNPVNTPTENNTINLDK